MGIIKFRQFYIGVSALVVWCALFLQMFLLVNAGFEIGQSLSKSLTNYFSFFTVLSNLLVALTLTSGFVKTKATFVSFFRKFSTQSAVMLYILIVGAVYAIVLSSLWDPKGLQLLSDRLLHYVNPILYLLFYLAFTRKVPLPWSSSVKWLLFPLLFLMYSLIRGSIIGWYPYPFVNADELGYKAVFVNAGILLLVFLGLGNLLILLLRNSKERE